MSIMRHNIVHYTTLSLNIYLHEKKVNYVLVLFIRNFLHTMPYSHCIYSIYNHKSGRY